MSLNKCHSTSGTTTTPCLSLTPPHSSDGGYRAFVPWGRPSPRRFRPPPWPQGQEGVTSGPLVHRPPYLGSQVRPGTSTFPLRTQLGSCKSPTSVTGTPRDPFQHTGRRGLRQASTSPLYRDPSVERPRLSSKVEHPVPSLLEQLEEYRGPDRRRPWD